MVLELRQFLLWRNPPSTLHQTIHCVVVRAERWSGSGAEHIPCARWSGRYGVTEFVVERTIRFQTTHRSAREIRFDDKFLLKWVLASFKRDSAIRMKGFLAGFWRAERSSAQGFKPFPTASRFFRVRFKNSKAQDFWREDFWGRSCKVYVRLTPHPFARTNSSPLIISSILRQKLRLLLLF